MYNFIFLKRTVFGDSVLARASEVPKCLAWEAVSSKLTQIENILVHFTGHYQEFLLAKLRAISRQMSINLKRTVTTSTGIKSKLHLK
jgi:hypothetical protein